MKNVAVVIPVLNGEKYIARAIESVLWQDYPNITLTVCNGGSTDDTEKIAKAYGVPVVQGELGLLQNWRCALKAAEGDYIKLLCHDDTLRNDCISKQVAALDNNPELSLVSCQRHYIDAEGKDAGCLVLDTKDKKIPGHDATYLMLKYGNLIGETSCTLFRKVAITFPDGMNWLLDMYMWTQLFAKGDFLYIAEQLANIRKHPEQDTYRVLNDPDYKFKEQSDKDHISELYERLWT